MGAAKGMSEDVTHKRPSDRELIHAKVIKINAKSVGDSLETYRQRCNDRITGNGNDAYFSPQSQAIMLERLDAMGPRPALESDDSGSVGGGGGLFDGSGSDSDSSS